MARRELLHRSKIDEFKDWLYYNRINWREGRGDWQVLQIEMEDGTWQAIFDRIGGDHLTVPDPLVRLVTRFTSKRYGCKELLMEACDLIKEVKDEYDIEPNGANWILKADSFLNKAGDIDDCIRSR